ncbi:MAG: Phosphatidyl-N-methylethanolamine N-methyltransferase [Trizodia sp. TS-e1964]|nr:MAG: Phosphatidyl-N-methylethanolamine N-methyltransferase [Trizodia sp. TS-e1964]
MPPQEQADLWMALRDRMKINWHEMTLQEKKAAYWIAFGPHGPRAQDPPGEGMKVFGYTVLGISVAIVIMWGLRSMAGPPPSTMTKEWQEKTNEYLKSQNIEPITETSSQAPEMTILHSTSPKLVDFTQTSLIVSALSIAFNPIFWNIVARNEYHNKTLTRLFGGNSRLGCYFLGATIFAIGIVRDLLYERALRSQPTHPLLDTPASSFLAYALFGAGNVLVLSSMWALGITGTYLGDYFGILMDERVTAFPFNVTDAPMYYGSTLSFLGSALYFGRPAGLLLTIEVLVLYLVALRFEE